MSIKVNETTDPVVEQVVCSLAPYKAEHSEAEIKVYRQNSVSIRARIVDPAFADVSRADRHDEVWSYLANLPEDVQSQISILLLLTPGEADGSFANLEFDHPIPSAL